MTKKKFPEGFFTKDRPIAKPRYIDADGLREYWLTNGKNERVYNTNDFLDSIDYQPTADVQPVVHCNECQWHDGEGDQMYCLNDFWNFNFTPNVYDSDFCSHGDKLDGDEHDNG